MLSKQWDFKPVTSIISLKLIAQTASEVPGFPDTHLYAGAVICATNSILLKQ